MAYSIKSVSERYGDAQIKTYLVEHGDISGQGDGKVFITDDTPHRHSYYEIHASTEGRHEYNIENRKVMISSGGMLIIPPNVHHCPFLSCEGYSAAVLSLEILHTDGTAGFYDFFTSSLDTRALKYLRTPARLVKSIEILGTGELYNTIGGMLRLKSALADAVTILFGESTERLKDIHTVAEREDAMALIENMANDPSASLADIAETVNYSQRQTQRLIKKMYGLSLSEIRRKMRQRASESEKEKEKEKGDKKCTEK